MGGKLIALWLYSAVFWGGHMGETGPGWYHHWSYDEVGRCAEMGVEALRDNRATAFVCQPENFPRPVPVAEAQ